MLDCLFKENEVPYGILEPFGLTQTMIEDLPKPVIVSILDGGRSPLLPVKVKDEKGNTVKARARFRLFRNDDGDIDVVFYPRVGRWPIDSYTPEEQEKLKNYRAILSHAPDDPELKCFVQLDPETDQVVYVPTPIIGKNLSVLINHFRPSASAIRLIQQGEPVSLLEGEDQVVAGIDLLSRKGIRIVQGTIQDWKREVEEYDMKRYNFGLYGCWYRNDGDDLEYVAEEDYTEEIWKAFDDEADRVKAMKR